MKLFNRPYLFHLHTALTDGALSLDQYGQAARRTGRALGFLEHIREKPTYNPFEFITAARNIGTRYGVPVKVGFEVSIVPGRLNIPLDALKTADMLGLAVHRYSGTPVDLLTAYTATVTRIRAIKPGVPLVWVHPGLWFRRNGYLRENTMYFFTLLRYAIARGLLIETNTRHDLPPLIVSGMIPRKQRIIGHDIHTAADLDQALKMRR